MARPCSAAVQAFLDNWSPRTSAAICDLYSFHLVGGEVLRFSGYQAAVTTPAPDAPDVDPPLYNFVLGPKLQRNKVSFRIGVQVDELEVEVYAALDELILTGGTLSWQEALHYGVFDGAYLDLWRCFMSPPGEAVGSVAWFYGRVADVELGRSKITIRVKSLLDLLTAQMPRRMFQAGCTHVFGDAMCGFDRESMLWDFLAESGTTGTRIIGSGITPTPSTLYDGGTILGLGGANAGFRRTVSRLVDSTVFVLDPWVFPVAIGDPFRLLPGCDHTLDTCQTVFSNLEHFGGFPYVPPPESAV